ncbi:MAG TPA: response regulator [Tepidisphaeraceae bacterium]|nr:response regulator [Tepidisphaeraceae bacterium]
MPTTAVQVLIVDDDEFALSILESTLSRMGYTTVSARDGNEAIEILRRGEIRLVITDWDMPGMNGVELCRVIRREDLSGYVYVIMLTGREGPRQQMEGLYAGADDFINKPLDPESLLICLKTAERILSLETRDVALFALAKLAESRDSETGSHVERVQSYSRLLAQHLSAEVKASAGIDAEYVRLLYQTSPLHDLGKVGIPDAVLLKPGKLTATEFAIMKTHTIVGAETLDAALNRFPSARFLQLAREIAISHHEKFDGTGYPYGLAGQQIPMCGRIVAVADVYDALTSRRVYKEAVTHEQAAAIIKRDSGTHFDPEVVGAFLRAEEQIIDMRERLRDDLAPSSQPPAPLPPPPPVVSDQRSCKILIAEDDPVLLQKLAELLAGTGEPIFLASDGEEAKHILDEHKPRVVISDWEMPKIDGVELCGQIRRDVEIEPVYFVMLTAHSNKERLLDAYRAGVDDFVAKPFDPEELLARVRAGIRSGKLHDELVRKATGSQAINAQLTQLNSRLEKLAITDELTGLFNRRHAMSRLEEQWALAERYSRPLTIAMIDIDHFKKINDVYGHHAGDMVLRRVAMVLREQTRETDTVCRVGGEEFLIIFPAQTTLEARVCAERFRVAVAQHPFDIGDASTRVTVSIGLAARDRGLAQFTDLLKAADLTLYAAKRAGRNVVHVHNPFETPVPPAMLNESPAGTGAAGSSASSPPPAPIDFAVVLKTCGGDANFAGAVMERFKSQAGVEVGRIDQGVATGDADAIRRAAHTLKSMAAYVSATAASQLADRIESLAREKTLAEVPALLVTLRTQVNLTIQWITQNAAASVKQCA